MKFTNKNAIIDLILKEIKEKAYKFIFKYETKWYSFWVPKFLVDTKIDESLKDKYQTFSFKLIDDFEFQVYSKDTGIVHYVGMSFFVKFFGDSEMMIKEN